MLKGKSRVTYACKDSVQGLLTLALQFLLILLPISCPKIRILIRPNHYIVYQ